MVFQSYVTTFVVYFSTNQILLECSGSIASEIGIPREHINSESINVSSNILIAVIQ